MKSVIESINKINDEKTLKELEKISYETFDLIRKSQLSKEDKEYIYKVMESVAENVKNHIKDIIKNKE